VADWERTLKDMRGCGGCKEKMIQGMKAMAVQDKPKRLCITNWQSPGDIVMLTAAVRDLHKAYPGRFQTDVITSCMDLWDNNPYITKFTESWVNDFAAEVRDARPAIPAERDGIMFIPAQYPLVNHSNQRPVHFIEGFHGYFESVLGLTIPVTEFRGDIHLADTEKLWMSQVAEMGVSEPFWLLMSGGKWDFTAKWPNPNTLQEVVNRLRGKVLFVQIGTEGNWEPGLCSVIDMVTQTSLRMLVRLIYHAQGCLTPLNGIMHLAAAVETPSGKARPCVVVAGGREPTQWEAYPTHRYLSTHGALPCCNPDACWKSRCTPVGDKDEKDSSGAICKNYIEVEAPASPHCRTQMKTIRVAKCIDMITADDIVSAIESYYTGGLCEHIK